MRCEAFAGAPVFLPYKHLGEWIVLMKVRFGKWLGLCISVVALFVTASPALASGAGPSGVNIGFDFNWNTVGSPGGYTASFISSASASGGTLDNCNTPVTPTLQSCNFAISYSIGGVAQTAVSPGGAYSTWNGSCDNPGNTAPLTLFNCFNANSFGQIFMASATGTLSGLTMPLTCLNPAGTPPTGLFAVLYQVIVPNGSTIPATPLAQTPVDLSTCPTLTSWTGHTFSAGDFAAIPMNFSNVTLTSGNFYGIFFAGLAPGAPLPGANTAAPVPTLSQWGMLLMALLLGAFGAWKLRQRAVA